MLIHALGAALLLAGSLLAQGARSLACTPTTVSADGAPPTSAANPIAQALRLAAPGATIDLAAGDYPAFGIGFDNKNDASNAPIPGGTQGQPIVVRGGPGVRVVPQGKGDTISICQQIACGYVEFEDLVIVPGTRAGVIFYRSGEGQVHRGFAFRDCDILGEYDHARASGPASKWGVSAHQIADFEWRGVRRASRIENIKDEHAFYLQNTLGDVTIENVEAKRLGRTFVQLVARSHEGPAATGTVTIRKCKVDDAGIAAGDAYKGGSAITIAGTGPQCTVRIEQNVVRAGFDPALLKLTKSGEPYGSGACVVWDGGDTRGNGSVTVARNEFVFAPGCGDRPLASFASCTNLRLDGNVFRAGNPKVASLAVDPHDEFGRPKSRANGKVALGAANELAGALEIAGALYTNNPGGELKSRYAGAR
jgi:hypothetical protein